MRIPNLLTIFFAPGGKLEYLKAWAAFEDGNWYYIKVGNNTAKSMNLSNSTMEQRVAVQVHGAYSVNIRQDWLDKLNLSMPQTTEEFRQALIAMQQGTSTTMARRMSVMLRILVLTAFIRALASGSVCRTACSRKTPAPALWKFRT